MENGQDPAKSRSLFSFSAQIRTGIVRIWTQKTKTCRESLRRPILPSEDRPGWRSNRLLGRRAGSPDNPTSWCDPPCLLPLADLAPAAPAPAAPRELLNRQPLPAGRPPPAARSPAAPRRSPPPAARSPAARSPVVAHRPPLAATRLPAGPSHDDPSPRHHWALGDQLLLTGAIETLGLYRWRSRA